MPTHLEAVSLDLILPNILSRIPSTIINATLYGKGNMRLKPSNSGSTAGSPSILSSAARSPVRNHSRAPMQYIRHSAWKERLEGGGCGGSRCKELNHNLVLRNWTRRPLPF